VGPGPLSQGERDQKSVVSALLPARDSKRFSGIPAYNCTEGGPGEELNVFSLVWLPFFLRGTYGKSQVVHFLFHWPL